MGTRWGQGQESGLYYLNARYYNSETGQFISRDTYKGSPYTSWTHNLYSYTGNNPINYVDPSGHIMVVDNDRFYDDIVDLVPDPDPEPDNDVNPNNNGNTQNDSLIINSIGVISSVGYDVSSTLNDEIFGMGFVNMSKELFDDIKIGSNSVLYFADVLSLCADGYDVVSSAILGLLHFFANNGVIKLIQYGFMVLGYQGIGVVIAAAALSSLICYFTLDNLDEIIVRKREYDYDIDPDFLFDY